MKKIVKICAVVEFIILMIFTMSACEEEHTHLYSDVYSKNALNHWKECSCGDKKEEESHTFGSWNTTKEATETEEGMKERECSVCHYKETESISMLEHTKHTYSTEWMIDKEATCTEVGSKSHHCLICDDKTDITEIPAGHIYLTEWTIDKEATCTEAGSKSHHCLICDNKTDITEILAGHKYDSHDTCERCGYTIVDGTEGLKYQLSETNDYYSVVNIGEATDLDIVIPSKYKGLPVAKIGPSAFKNCDSLTSVVIPDSIISIEEYAFHFCKNLTSLTIPNSVTSIGSYAFSACSNLKNVVISNNITTIASGTFLWCESLESIEIPNSVTDIEPNSFYNCSALTSLTIPNEVLSIGDSAFSRCIRLVEIYNLSSLNITKGSEDNGSVGYYAKAIHTSLEEESNLIEENNFIFFKDERDKYILVKYSGMDSELILPEGIEGKSYEINQYAFYNCNKIRSIILSNRITSIGFNAFGLCENLISITIGSGVKEIGALSFEGCKSLKSVLIDSGVEEIGSGAFINCTSLESIEIPNSVINIGYAAFENCSSLTSISIPFVGGNLSDISSTYIGYIFGGYTYEENLNCVPSSLKEIIITGGESIPPYAFSGCNNLTNITIPNSVISIGFSAFSGCNRLTSLALPNGIVSIGAYAFSECYNLISMIIRESVTSIGYSAFSACDRLALYCEATSLPSEWSSAWNFSNRPVYWYSENEPATSGNYWHYVNNKVVIWE